MVGDGSENRHRQDGLNDLSRTSGEKITTCHSLGLSLPVARASVAGSRRGSSSQCARARVPRSQAPFPQLASLPLGEWASPGVEGRCWRLCSSSEQIDEKRMDEYKWNSQLLQSYNLAVLKHLMELWIKKNEIIVSADDDCLWYADKQGNWHFGFNCRFLQFCCGNCTYRYCCQDPMQLITERQQKYCATTNLSPTTVAGIASAIFLFIVIIGIIVCCFLCSCCYLYQRRQRLRQAFTGAREVIYSYPMQPTSPSKNMTPVPYPTAPAYGAASTSYPVNPAYPPNVPPGSYAPYPTAPAYSTATAPPYA
ncbi:protein shisa-4 isoform X2 [Narcine bancroftii]|uniref:protein shisa-4 isoform X2 n=1 Tax=Narcine bancroftii TaxID=1343680 RepID=UPI003831205E